MTYRQFKEIFSGIQKDNFCADFSAAPQHLVALEGRGIMPEGGENGQAKPANLEKLAAAHTCVVISASRMRENAVAAPL